MKRKDDESETEGTENKRPREKEITNDARNKAKRTIKTAKEIRETVRT